MSMRIVCAALLLAFSVACGSSSSPASPSPTPTPTPTASNVGASIVANSALLTTTAYSPNPIAVAVGGSVTWTNNDTIAHTSTADGGAWNSGTIAAGGTFSRTFASAGSFPYHCAIHPGMIGTVTVQ
jgi:plastocyanin